MVRNSEVGLPQDPFGKGDIGYELIILEKAISFCLNLELHAKIAK